MPRVADYDTPKRDNTTPSCAVCNRRKVKCDRVYPCAPCKKTGLECTFPERSNKRARRKPPTPLSETTPTDPERRIIDQPSQPLVERHSSSEDGSPEVRRTFGGIGYEVASNGSSAPRRDTGPLARRASPLSSGRPTAFIFSSQLKPVYEPLRLSFTQTIAIWDAYQSHVDPVAKVFHRDPVIPTLLKGDDSSPSDEILDTQRLPDECLFRAVCFATAVATDDADLLGLPESHSESLIQRFRGDVEAMLSQAKFAKSRELRVLQSLVLYLIALQSIGEDETAWSMLGIAIRIASTLGLPQDIGADAVRGPLIPYELEMRRRLWWAILALDARITRILGRTGYLSHNFSDVPRPSNVDDNELHPSMTEMPDRPTPLSDSVYIQYRATLSEVLPLIYTSGKSQDRCTDILGMIDEAEHQIQEQFIQHIDQTVPIQLLTHIAGVGYIMRIKIAMYSIYPTAVDPEMQSPYASEAFQLAKDSMENFLLCWTDPSLKQWQWHWKDFFGWHTFRIFVQEIAKRSSCFEVIEAWALVQKIAMLLVPALKLGEEKARLVGDLRMLIEAGDARLETASSARSSVAKRTRTTMGSSPHNAIFPDTERSFTIDSSLQDDGEDGGLQAAPFNLKAINWVEMDRLLAQLGTYSGG